jgi:hypothetical protein
MLLPARRSSSGGGTGVSTNCLYEPAPANPLEQLPPVPLHSEQGSSGAAQLLLLQQHSSSSSSIGLSDGTAVGAATTAGTPWVNRTSSSGGSEPAAAAAAAVGGVAGVMGSRPGQPQPQLGSLLGGALHSLAALQGVLQEGQAAADALLGR